MLNLSHEESVEKKSDDSEKSKKKFKSLRSQSDRYEKSIADTWNKLIWSLPGIQHFKARPASLLLSSVGL